MIFELLMRLTERGLPRAGEQILLLSSFCDLGMAAASMVLASLALSVPNEIEKRCSSTLDSDSTAE
eukprot:6622971-Pyramimonas_sp.AAC.1